MIVALVFCFSFLVGANAYGEWTTVRATDEATVYVDTETILHKGNSTRIWQLHDYKLPHSSPDIPPTDIFLSRRVQFEFDCAEDLVRFVTITLHSGQMGDGRVVLSDVEPSNWHPVASGSIGQRMWKLACESNGSGK